MKYLVSSFFESFEVVKKDKYIIIFSLIPVLIGIVLYYILGSYIFDDFQAWILELINSKIQSGGWGKFFSWIILILLSAVMYFVVSWTFFLIVSLIASPFNDIISNRTEKAIRGHVPETLDNSLGRLMKRVGFTLFNEMKKISFIIMMTILALVLNFIPILAPVSFLLSALLFSVGLVDYSWSRHDLKFGSCVNNMRNFFLSYSLSGVIFLALIAIPILNLFILPYAVIYYTILYTKNEMKELAPGPDKIQ